MSEIIDLTTTYGIDVRTYYDEVVQGDSYSRTIRVTGLDLTNYIGRCHWLDGTWDDISSNVVLNSNNNISVNNLDVPNSTGEYTILISNIETSTLNVGSFYYGDLELNDGNNNVITVIRIRIRVKGGATRD